MITEITIKNYKSVADVTIPLGRFNVFIGANGCGKSNILEAVALAAAANADKLDNEFLYNRGIRVAEPELMRSAFEDTLSKKEIELYVKFSEGDDYSARLAHDDGPYSKWRELNYDELVNGIEEGIRKVTNLEVKDAPNTVKMGAFLYRLLYRYYLKGQEEFVELADKAKNIVNDGKALEILQREAIHFIKSPLLQNFIIHSIEFSILRDPQSSHAITPLGPQGQGFFELLTRLEKAEKETLNEYMTDIEWFDSFDIEPGDKGTGVRKLWIKDRFFAETIKQFDQRSSNEGFLFLLFYYTLLISKYTPQFFAIDNIETALHPRLAAHLVRNLTRLAVEYDRQVLVTTHNPGVLDGLDLSNDEIRLFAVRRDLDGHTKIQRIFREDKNNVRLSEAWIRGMIGGVPTNF